MSNLQPTPITDKNGKLTTVHKKVGETDTSSARVAGLKPSRASAKRTAVKPPKFEAANWFRDGHALELGAKDKEGAQLVYLDGSPIGTVTSADESQYSPLAGTRLIQFTSEKKIWRVSLDGSEGEVPAYINSYNGHDSRASAVSDHADKVLNMRWKLARSEEFLKQDGIAFDRHKGYDFGSRGHGIEIPGEWMTGFSGTITSGELHTTAEFFTKDGNSATLQPNEFDFRGMEKKPSVTVQLGKGSGYHALPISEDGSLDVSSINPKNDTERKFLGDLQGVVKDIMDTRDKPSTMRVPR